MSIIRTNQITNTAGDASPIIPGAVLQIQSTTKSDLFSTTTTNSFVEITGLNVSITPKATSSKVMLTGIVGVGNTTATAGVSIKVQRNGIDIGIGDANSSNKRSMATTDVRAYQPRQLSINFLDSPLTTSACVYKVFVLSASATTRINASGENGTGTNHNRTISTITAMEIGG